MKRSSIIATALVFLLLLLASCGETALSSADPQYGSALQGTSYQESIEPTAHTQAAAPGTEPKTSTAAASSPSAAATTTKYTVDTSTTKTTTVVISTVTNLPTKTQPPNPTPDFKLAIIGPNRVKVGESIRLTAQFVNLPEGAEQAEGQYWNFMWGGLGLSDLDVITLPDTREQTITITGVAPGAATVAAAVSYGRLWSAVSDLYTITVIE